MEDERDETLRRDFDRLSPELELRFDGSVESVLGGLYIERTDGWVMADLLTHHAVSQTLVCVQVVCFTEQRVERLADAIPVRRRRRHGKCRHQLIHAHTDTWQCDEANLHCVSNKLHPPAVCAIFFYRKPIMVIPGTFCQSTIHWQPITFSPHNPVFLSLACIVFYHVLLPEFTYYIVHYGQHV